MKNLDKEQIQQLVKAAYGQVATGQDGQEGCGCGTGGPDLRRYARSLGYSEAEIDAIPEAANLGLSCGNPNALAGLRVGETVLDLGSGAGFDCFIAAVKVGPAGKVIGVDMTTEMIEKAKANARGSGVTNVEFRLGEIEKLPVEDASVDVVISNCVINLSADKEAVFREIRRVLKPGGRVAVSDIVLLRELPDSIRDSIAAYTGCVGGAVRVEEYRRLMVAAGLKEVELATSGSSCCGGADTSDPVGRAIMAAIGEEASLAAFIASAHISARK
jgi:SAM-dependent methyltransferase